MWEQTVQESHCAWHCQRAESQSDRKTINKLTLWWKPLSMAADVEWKIHWNEHQRSVNNLWSWKYGNWTVIWLLLCITDLFAAFIGKRASNAASTPCWEWASTERQLFVVMEVRSLDSDLVAVMHNRCIGCFCGRKRQQQGHRPILRISVNGASMIFSFASWVLYVPIGCRHPFMRYWQPLTRKTTMTCSLPHPENERQQSVNSFSSASVVMMASRGSSRT